MVFDSGGSETLEIHNGFSGNDDSEQLRAIDRMLFLAYNEGSEHGRKVALKETAEKIGTAITRLLES